MVSLHQKVRIRSCTSSVAAVVKVTVRILLIATLQSNQTKKDSCQGICLPCSCIALSKDTFFKFSVGRIKRFRCVITNYFPIDRLEKRLVNLQSKDEKDGSFIGSLLKQIDYKFFPQLYERNRKFHCFKACSKAFCFF